MAMVVMTVALTALVAVFSNGIIGMRSASQKTTATFLADAQMETYNAMVARDIGLDLSSTTVSALDTTYTGDASCANSSLSETCTANGVGGTLGVPTGTLPDSCTTINSWYPTTDPCTPSRSVTSSTTPASPDGRSYRVDTYIIDVPATSTAPFKAAYKAVTVVVRDGNNLSLVLARESAEFDCANGEVPDSTDC